MSKSRLFMGRCSSWVVILLLMGGVASAGLRGPKKEGVRYDPGTGKFTTAPPPVGTTPGEADMGSRYDPRTGKFTAEPKNKFRTPLGERVRERENKFNSTIQEYQNLGNSPNPPADIKEWGTSKEKSIEKMLSKFKKSGNKGDAPPVLRRTETLSEESPRSRGDKEPGRGWVNTPKVSDGDGGIGKVSAEEPVRSRRSFEDDAEARSARRGDGALNRPKRSLDDEWEKRNVEDVPELQEEVLRGTKERDRIKSEEAKAEQKAEEGANAEPDGGGDKDKLLAEAGTDETAIDPKTGRPAKGKPGSPKSGAPKKPGASGSKPSTGKAKGGSPSSGASGSKGTLSQAQIRAIYAKDKD